MQLIRENFVCVAVPTEVCNARTPEGDFLRSAGVKKQWVTSSGYMTCIAADGTPLGHEPSAKILAAFRQLPERQRKPDAAQLRALEPTEQVVPSPPRGGIVLKVHGRFLGRDERGQLRHIESGDFPQLRGKKDDLDFLLAPNTEYLWLTEPEWRAWVPAEPVPGAKIAVDPAIALRIARFHLSPRRALTSEDGIVDRRHVGTAELGLVVTEVTPQRIQMRLTGFIHHGSTYDAAKATSPNGPLDFGFETPLHGVLEYDRTQRVFVRVDLVAPGEVWGRWGDANGKSQTIERPGRAPIGFAFELATGSSPTNRLPPGGNGERALRAGYFGEVK